MVTAVARMVRGLGENWPRLSAIRVPTFTGISRHG